MYQLCHVIIQSLCYIYTVGTGIVIHYVYCPFSLASQRFRGLLGAQIIGAGAQDHSLFMRVSSPGLHIAHCSHSHGYSIRIPESRVPYTYMPLGFMGGFAI